MPARRTPRQERSRQMVERIVDAAATVLARDGFQRASTNRIAREAGVSPGSVYQYFEGKEEIVAALSRRLVDDFGEDLSPVLRTIAAKPRDEVTSLMIGATIDALERHAALLRAMVDRVPGDEQAEALRDVRARIGDAVYHLLLLHSATDDDEMLQRTTWLIVETTQHLIVRYVLDDPPITRQALIAGVEQMVTALLSAR